MSVLTYLVTNYNNGRFLPDCLESLQRQTDSRWQALVVDDASTDDSLDVLKPWLGDQIRLVVNPHNLGRIGTLRRCLDLAETDLVALLDPDDALESQTTARVLQTYETRPDAGFVYSKMQCYDLTFTVAQEILGRALAPWETCMTAGHVPNLRTFRMSAYRQTAGLDETMLYAEDADLIYKLEEVTRPIFIDEVLYKYRIVPTSLSHEPVKKTIGRKNNVRARQNALARRGIGGLLGVCHRLRFWAEYWRYRDQTRLFEQRLLNRGLELLTRAEHRFRNRAG